jgi:predicted membrane protein
VPKAAGTDCINDSIMWHVCQTVIHGTNDGIQEVIWFDGFAAIRAAGNRHRACP